MSKKKDKDTYKVTVGAEEADQLVYRILKQHMKWANDSDLMTRTEQIAFKVVINFFRNPKP